MLVHYGIVETMPELGGQRAALALQVSFSNPLEELTAPCWVLKHEWMQWLILIISLVGFRIT